VAELVVGAVMAIKPLLFKFYEGSIIYNIYGLGKKIKQVLKKVWGKLLATIPTFALY
jgi:hypothetical protein